jgi:hypothetical protein
MTLHPPPAVPADLVSRQKSVFNAVFAGRHQQVRQET